MASAQRAGAVAAELCRRVAVAGGAGTALLALLRHAPVWLACLEGAAALVALRLCAGTGIAAVQRSIELDRRAAEARKEART
jgi:hypothetical protein